MNDFVKELASTLIDGISSLNDDAKIVIRGVLDKIDDKNIIDNNKATLIKQALDKLCGGTWNVITYPSHEICTGSTLSCFHWRDREWIYAEQTTNTSYNASEIESFMDAEFERSPISDINVVQRAAKKKVTDRFSGTWRVHVAKLTNGYSSHICGAVWESDGYTFFIYRTG